MQTPPSFVLGKEVTTASSELSESAGSLLACRDDGTVLFANRHSIDVFHNRDDEWTMTYSLPVADRPDWLALNSNATYACAIWPDRMRLYEMSSDGNLTQLHNSFKLEDKEPLVQVFWHPTDPHYLYIFRKSQIVLISLPRRSSGHASRLVKQADKEIVGACFRKSCMFLLVLLRSGTCLYLNPDLTTVGRLRPFSQVLKPDECPDGLFSFEPNLLLSCVGGSVLAYDYNCSRSGRQRIGTLPLRRLGRISMYQLSSGQIAIGGSDSDEIAVINVTKENGDVVIKELALEEEAIQLPMNENGSPTSVVWQIAGAGRTVFVLSNYGRLYPFKVEQCLKQAADKKSLEKRLDDASPPKSQTATNNVGTVVQDTKRELDELLQTCGDQIRELVDAASTLAGQSNLLNLCKDRAYGSSLESAPVLSTRLQSASNKVFRKLAELEQKLDTMSTMLKNNQNKAVAMLSAQIESLKISRSMIKAQRRRSERPRTRGEPVILHQLDLIRNYTLQSMMPSKPHVVRVSIGPNVNSEWEVLSPKQCERAISKSDSVVRLSELRASRAREDGKASAGGVTFWSFREDHVASPDASDRVSAQLSAETHVKSTFGSVTPQRYNVTASRRDEQQTLREYPHSLSSSALQITSFERRDEGKTSLGEKDDDVGSGALEQEDHDQRVGVSSDNSLSDYTEESEVDDNEEDFESYYTEAAQGETATPTRADTSNVDSLFGGLQLTADAPRDGDVSKCSPATNMSDENTICGDKVKDSAGQKSSLFSFSIDCLTSSTEVTSKTSQVFATPESNRETTPLLPLFPNAFSGSSPNTANKTGGLFSFSETKENAPTFNFNKPLVGSPAAGFFNPVFPASTGGFSFVSSGANGLNPVINATGAEPERSSSFFTNKAAPPAVQVTEGTKDSADSTSGKAESPKTVVFPATTTSQPKLFNVQPDPLFTFQQPSYPAPGPFSTASPSTSLTPQTISAADTDPSVQPFISIETSQSSSSTVPTTLSEESPSLLGDTVAEKSQSSQRDDSQRSVDHKSLDEAAPLNTANGNDGKTTAVAVSKPSLSVASVDSAPSLLETSPAKSSEKQAEQASTQSPVRPTGFFGVPTIVTSTANAFNLANPQKPSFSLSFGSQTSAGSLFGSTTSNANNNSFSGFSFLQNSVATSSAATSNVPLFSFSFSAQSSPATTSGTQPNLFSTSPFSQKTPQPLFSDNVSQPNLIASSAVAAAAASSAGFTFGKPSDGTLKQTQSLFGKPISEPSTTQQSLFASSSLFGTSQSHPSTFPFSTTTSAESAPKPSLFNFSSLFPSASPAENTSSTEAVASSASPFGTLSSTTKSPFFSAAASSNPETSKPTPLFGGSPFGGFNIGADKTTTPLFGASILTTSTTSSTTPLFAANAGSAGKSEATTPTPLFGQSTASQSSFFSGGTTTTTTPSPFGASAALPSNTGGLFSNSPFGKTTGVFANTGPAFPQSSPFKLFGNTGGSSTPLFGSSTKFAQSSDKASGGLFGSVGTSQTQLFGAAQSSSTFLNKPLDQAAKEEAKSKYSGKSFMTYRQ